MIAIYLLAVFAFYIGMYFLERYFLRSSILDREELRNYLNKLLVYYDGVSGSSLYGVYKGEQKNKALPRIDRVYNVSFAWDITGYGRVPRFTPEARAISRQYKKVLNERKENFRKARKVAMQELLKTISEL